MTSMRQRIDHRAAVVPFGKRSSNSEFIAIGLDSTYSCREQSAVVPVRGKDADVRLKPSKRFIQNFHKRRCKTELQSFRRRRGCVAVPKRISRAFRNRLRSQLLHSFDRDSLEELVNTELGDADHEAATFETITSQGPLDKQARQLVAWAVQRDVVDRLVAGAAMRRPGVKEWQALQGDYNDLPERAFDWGGADRSRTLLAAGVVLLAGAILCAVLIFVLADGDDSPYLLIVPSPTLLPRIVIADPWVLEIQTSASNETHVITEYVGEPVLLGPDAGPSCVKLLDNAPKDAFSRTDKKRPSTAAHPVAICLANDETKYVSTTEPRVTNLASRTTVTVTLRDPNNPEQQFRRRITASKPTKPDHAEVVVIDESHKVSQAENDQ